jgi:hypothetical protein
MDPDELEDAVTAVQQQADTLRADVDRLRTEYDRTVRAFDQLSQKLRYPGTKFLVELEYKLVYDTTVTATTAPAVSTWPAATPFDTLPGTLHAVYVVSAYAPSSNTPVVITDGSVIVAPSNAVSVAIQRQRQTSPTRIEAKIIIDNSTGVDQSLALRVWRRLGMGS